MEPGSHLAPLRRMERMHKLPMEDTYSRYWCLGRWLPLAFSRFEALTCQALNRLWTSLASRLASEVSIWPRPGEADRSLSEIA